MSLFSRIRDTFAPSKESKGTFVIAAPTNSDLEEQFKGKVSEEDSKKTKELGEEHPFNYEMMEGLYKKFGFAMGVIDKIVDFVWGPEIVVKTKDKRVKAILEQWMEDVNFNSVGRQWLREALIKGTAYLELGGNETEIPQGVKLLNSNTMFIKRDEKGVTQAYNQFLGNKRMSRVTLDKTKVIKFKPFEVAVLRINRVSDDAYGMGILHPAMKTIDSLLKAEKDMHQMLSRKANSPMVAYLGDVDKGILPDPSDVQSLAQKMTFMNNKTEWAFSADVKLDVLDFGNVSEKFSGVIEHDIDMLFFAFQVPEVLMGRGSIPEGLAKVQLEAFQRRIKSIQVEIEKEIESQIFKRIMAASGLEATVDIEWGQAGEDEKNKRLERLTVLLQNPVLHPKMRLELERQVAIILDIDEDLIKEDDVEREEEENEPQPRVPGSNEHVHPTKVWSKVNVGKLEL